MRVVERAQEGILLVIAAKLADRVLRQQLAIEGFAPLESGGAHSCRRADAFQRVLGVRDDERPMLRTEKARGVESLQFFALAQIEPLPRSEEHTSELQY